MNIEDLILEMQVPVLGTKMIIEHIIYTMQENIIMTRKEAEELFALVNMSLLGIKYIEQIRQEYRTEYIKEMERHRSERLTN